MFIKKNEEIVGEIKLREGYRFEKPPVIQPPIEPPDVDPPDIEEPPVIPSDGDPYRPEGETVRFCDNALDVDTALAMSQGRGGVVSLRTPAAVSRFFDFLQQISLRGSPSKPTYIEFHAPYTKNCRLNGKVLHSNLVFAGLDLNADVEHRDSEAMTWLGAHKNIVFYKARCRGFKYGIGGGSPTSGDRTVNVPEEFVFHDYDCSDCLHPNHPKASLIKTDSGYVRNKGDRAQGMYFGAIRNLRFRGKINFSRIGWNPASDPNRERCDMFSNGLYFGQGVDGVHFEDAMVVLTEVSNNCIVHKGRGFFGDERSTIHMSRCANGISFGTNENPQWPCGGDFKGRLVIDRLNPISHLETSPDFASQTNAGVGVSLCNVDGLYLAIVDIGNNEKVGNAVCRKNTALMISSGDDNALSMFRIGIGRLTAGTGRQLAEVRDHVIVPGQQINVMQVEGTDRQVQIRNFVGDKKKHGVQINGVEVASW